ncbi:MAG: KGG domain-containing protein [Duganella sp.]
MATNDQGNNQGSKQGSSQGGKKRGFAAMNPDQQREIASEGGRAAHEKGTAHEFTSEEARRAGSMSHKNDRSSQSATGGSRSGSGAGDSDDSSGGKGGRTGRSKS